MMHLGDFGTWNSKQKSYIKKVMPELCIVLGNVLKIVYIFNDKKQHVQNNVGL